MPDSSHIIDREGRRWTAEARRERLPSGYVTSFTLRHGCRTIYLTESEWQTLRFRYLQARQEAQAA